ncbi:hypothetical protein F5146DRAFT_1000259 [Armillaria mellea]|nr:hypothetical protein F5146DRAFT_1000259 [Armillaria mellea]
MFDDHTISAESNNDNMFLTVDMRNLLEKKLASLRHMQRQESIFHILSQMQRRKSTNPVDKVAGLIYMFYSQYIPIYDANQSAEDAWTELVYRTKKGGDKCYGLRIDSCTVKGLGDKSPVIPRRGELHFNSGLKKHTFKIVACHAYLIPDGKYTLVGTSKHSATMEGVIWVVGKTEGLGKKFRKVSGVVWPINGDEA